ncbi:WXG100 family type VII secretion target [Streptomyces sp. NPDC051664]|uniref:WXG100 family type VII secretion target n=1 Tax=Streptomyces sp. NPDC051664 TaxID=3365668 RepID=UPI0037A98A09
MAGDIWINHSAAKAFSDEMLNETQAISAVVTELEGTLGGIVNNWLGDDRDIYINKVQPTWNREVSSLSLILQRHAVTLDDISDNYKQTVYRNAQGFEEIKF